MDSSNAEKAAREYAKYHSGVSPVTTIGEKLQTAFLAGAESRDAEVAELREQLAAAEARAGKVWDFVTEPLTWQESLSRDFAGKPMARFVDRDEIAALMLNLSPSVVLEDRDREVAARTLERYADSPWSPSAYYLRSCAAAIRAGGDTFPEQHVRGLYSDELQTMVDELREAHRIAKDWSRRNEDASEVASYVRNALDVLEVELAEWPRAAAIRKGDNA